MLGIHRYSGFSAADVLSRIGESESYFNQFPVSPNSGWKTTRAAGILAAYIAANPDLTAEDVAAWAYHNGLEDWEITLDQDDGTTLSGTIYFLDGYPLGSNFSSNFRDWQNGYEISSLPSLPSTPVSQPAYIQQPQQLAPTAATPTFIPSQPAPTYAPQPTPAAVTPMTPAAQPLPVAAAPQSAVVAKKSTSEFPWMLLLIGAAVIFFLMNKKKGRK